MDSDDEWFSTNSYERDDESSINIKISLATPTFIKPALIWGWLYSRTYINGFAKWTRTQTLFQYE